MLGGKQQGQPCIWLQRKWQEEEEPVSKRAARSLTPPPDIEPGLLSEHPRNPESGQSRGEFWKCLLLILQDLNKEFSKVWFVSAVLLTLSALYFI